MGETTNAVEEKVEVKQYVISKSYSRTISQDYQSYKFTATLEEVIYAVDDADLKKQSAALFEKVKAMVEADIHTILQ